MYLFTNRGERHEDHIPAYCFEDSHKAASRFFNEGLITREQGLKMIELIDFMKPNQWVEINFKDASGGSEVHFNAIKLVCGAQIPIT